MNLDLRSLIALQDIEQKIAGLQKSISEVPSRLQALQQQLEDVNRAHEQRVTHCHELAKRRRSLEGDVDTLRARLSKLKDQLMAVKTNKEYTAMLHEIQAVETQIRSEEDNVLGIMEEMETVEGDLKGAEKELRARTEQIRQGIGECEKSVPGLESELSRLSQEKAATEAQLQSDLLARYRRIADARRGIALAEAKGELCGACHVRIRPQVYANLFKNEDLYFCDSCSRILFLRELI